MTGAEIPEGAAPFLNAMSNKGVSHTYKPMKTFSKISLALVVACSLGGVAFGKDGQGDDQGKPGKHNQQGRGGRAQVEIPRFGVPKNANLSDDLKKLISQYQDAAQKFAAGQKELLAQLKGSTDEQKQALKDLLKANRQQFLDDTTQLRADIREQLRELRQKFKDSGAGAVDNGAEGKGKGRPGRP